MATQENIIEYMKIVTMAITASRYTTAGFKVKICKIDYGDHIGTEMKYIFEDGSGILISAIFANSNEECSEWHLKTKKIYYNQFGFWGKDFKDFCEPFFKNTTEYTQKEAIEISKRVLSKIKNTAGLDNFKKLLEMNNIKEVA